MIPESYRRELSDQRVFATVADSRENEEARRDPEVGVSYASSEQVHHNLADFRLPRPGTLEPILAVAEMSFKCRLPKPHGLRDQIVDELRASGQKIFGFAAYIAITNGVCGGALVAIIGICAGSAWQCAAGASMAIVGRYVSRMCWRIAENLYKARVNFAIEHLTDAEPAIKE